MKFPCDLCGKYGHWKRNHNVDGSLPSHVKSCDYPPKPRFSNSRSSHHDWSSDSVHDRNDKAKHKTVSFNMATLTGASASTSSLSEHGTILDDGAPYYAFGLVELNLLADHAGLNPNPQLDGIPKALYGHTYWQYGKG